MIEEIIEKIIVLIALAIAFIILVGIDLKIKWQPWMQVMLVALRFMLLVIFAAIAVLALI